MDAGIAVIIVNYGTADLAIRAAESVLARRHGGRRVEVHVVDNASPGGDAARLRAWQAGGGAAAGVTLHLGDGNLGFGRGNNLVLHRLAARESPPAHVMLLNPDATLGNEAIAILADFLDSHPRAVAAGAGIARPDGTPVTAAFRFPSLTSEFSQALSFGPVARLTRRRAVPLPPGQPRGPVGWVSGAAVLIRLPALREAGFFDPAYFLYFEETDLMLQMTRRGGEIWHLPEARVIHAEGAATGVRSGERMRRRRPAYWYRSWRHYWRKNHGGPVAACAAACWAGGAALNHLIAALRRRQPQAPLHFFADFWALAGRPALGLPEAPLQEDGR